MNIDFHAHILPAADHGCKNVETALQQLRAAKQAHVDCVVATPHFYPQNESCTDFLTRRKQCAQELAKAMQGQNLPKVLLGAEVQLCPGLDRIEQLQELCIEGTNILLLELPPNYSVRSFDQTIDALLFSRKLTVVLAHIERYPSVHTDFLLDLGCLAQLNASAFCHFRSVKRALRSAQSDSVVALGSDIHGMEIGYGDYLKARKRLGSTYHELMDRTHELIFGENE